MDSINMPWHTTIAEYMRLNPEFQDTLKVYNTSKFTPLNTIIISGLDEYPDDEIIGVFALERSVSKRVNRTFVQDYIVWHKRDDSFTHYTSFKVNINNVKKIDEFWIKYGMGQYYGTSKEKPMKGDHWYKSVRDLPKELQNEGVRVLENFSMP